MAAEARIDHEKTLRTRTCSRRDLLATSAALGGAAAALGVLPAGAAPLSHTHSTARFQADEKTLVVALDGSPSDLDPHFANDYRSSLAIIAIYEGLLALKADKTDEYVGLLAETWEPNADKSVWTFHIRDGVTFHDGSPCDAPAIVESFKRDLTVGVGAFSTRMVPGPDAVSAPDAKTVVFDLGKPQPQFEGYTAGTYGVLAANTMIFKAHEAAGDYGRAWAQTNAEGTGTGPYKLESFDPTQQLVLVKNETYWGGWDGNHFEKIVIRVVPENATRRQLIEQGDVDLVDVLTYEDLSALKSNADLTINTAYSSRVDYFYLVEAGPLATPEARQAMNYAFPFQDVIDGVFKGFAKPAKGIVSEALRGFDPETFTYTTDIAKAKELFAVAGVAPGTEFTMAIESGDENVKSIAQLYQASLEQAGMKLAITQMETASYVDLLYGETPAEERPNMMWWAWWPLYNDGWSHVHDLVSQASGSAGGNCGLYFNQEVEDLLAKAGEDLEDEAYNADMADLQKVLNADDPPAIYYAQIQQTVVARKDVTGIVLNPINIGVYYFYQLGRGA